MKKLWMVLALASMLAGCASGPNRNPADPLEPYNRKMSEFNETVDRAVLKPVATAYQQATPVLVRTGVSNFFANLGDAWSFVNNGLQLRVEPAVTSFFRFAINSTMGLGGVLDVASEMGMDRYKQDFGLTLGRWGVPTGPYFVLPILGPSTIRDTAALPVDMWGNPVSLVDPVSARNSLYALRAVDARANLLRALTMATPLDLLHQNHLDAFAIVSSDSDFTRLAARLRESGARVFGFGEKKTPLPFVNACDTFTYLEALQVDAAAAGSDAPDQVGGASTAAAGTTRPTTNELRGDARLMNLLRAGIAASADDDGWANLGGVGSTIQRQAPDFDSRNWGYARLGDLIEAVGLFEVNRVKKTNGSTNLQVRDRRDKAR